MTTTSSRTEPIRRTIVYDEPGRFAGWPANYGMWAFGQEVVVVFLLGYTGPLRGVHARDMSRPFAPVLARSLDGGATWSTEEFNATVPGAAVLSGDEHQDLVLRAEDKIDADDFLPVPEPIDFTDSDTLVMAARTGLGGGSLAWFYLSQDRGHHWTGPHALPDFEQSGIAARTDIVPLGRSEALWLLTAAKEDGREGHVFAAHTGDGGATFTRRGWLGTEPEGMQIMPSSVLFGSTVLSAVRCHDPNTGENSPQFWIDLYASTDQGRTWELRAVPVADTGPSGNPPVLLAVGDALVCIYGYRGPGAGLRFTTSADSGRTWSAPEIVTDDVPMGDMGYPRAVVLDDDSLLACFYSNRGPESERFIEAVQWRR